MLHLLCGFLLQDTSCTTAKYSSFSDKQQTFQGNKIGHTYFILPKSNFVKLRNGYAVLVPLQEDHCKEAKLFFEDKDRVIREILASNDDIAFYFTYINGKIADKNGFCIVVEEFKNAEP